VEEGGFSVDSNEARQSNIDVDCEDGFVYGVTWDSSQKNQTKLRTQLDLAKPNDTVVGGNDYTEALACKEEGNVQYRLKDYMEALASYTSGIKICLGNEHLQSPFCDLLAVLYSNAAAAAIQCKRYDTAIEFANKAHALQPSSTKPLHRLAEAHFRSFKYQSAVSACLRGENLCTANSEGHTQFTPLLDQIAVEAASQGSFVGFPGRQLEVRSAGEDAWLGRPAPHVPSLDGPLDEDSALPSDDLGAAVAGPKMGLLSNMEQSDIAKDGKSASPHPNSVSSSTTPPRVSVRTDSIATWHYADSVLAFRKQRTSFRCLGEAVAAARDGDRILLRKGVHNGMGQCIDINKRLFVEGEGRLGETVIDQRANVPTFRFMRGGAVVRNIEFDQTGFREALMIAGSADVAPLIDHCTIKCSGDNAVDVGGQARPLLRDCTISAKKVGLRVYDASLPRLHACVIEKCGEQGIKLMEASRLEALQCAVVDCEEDGVVVMGSTQVALVDCVIEGNKGPGVDCSDSGRCTIRGGRIWNNVGGVWVWDTSSAKMERVTLNGGPAHVVLADGEGRLDARGCVLHGTVHATDTAWKGLIECVDPGNKFVDPENPTDFPAEEGPFRFVPNPYTRKQ